MSRSKNAEIAVLQEQMEASKKEIEKLAENTRTSFEDVHTKLDANDKALAARLSSLEDSVKAAGFIWKVIATTGSLLSGAFGVLATKLISYWLEGPK